MKLRFTRRAAQDLADIAEHIRVDNPSASVRVRASILNTIETLIRFPRLGRPQTVAGVRKLFTRRYSYAVYYVADAAANEIVILTIRHSARKPSDG